MIKKCRLSLFIILLFAHLVTLGVTPEETERYNQCKTISKGLLYLDQEALRLIRERTAPITKDYCWHLTDIFHSDRLKPMQNALDKKKVTILRSLIGKLDIAFNAPSYRRKTVIATAYSALKSWLDNERVLFNQANRKFIQQYDIQKAQELKNTPRAQQPKQPRIPTEKLEPEKEVELTTAQNEEPKADKNKTDMDSQQPARQHEGPFEYNAPEADEDQMSTKSILADALGWISKHKALSGIVGGLAGYSILAELFGWFPFRTASVPQG